MATVGAVGGSGCRRTDSGGVAVSEDAGDLEAGCWRFGGNSAAARRWLSPARHRRGHRIADWPDQGTVAARSGHGPGHGHGTPHSHYWGVPRTSDALSNERRGRGKIRERGALDAARVWRLSARYSAPAVQLRTSGQALRTTETTPTGSTDDLRDGRGTELSRSAFRIECVRWRIVTPENAVPMLRERLGNATGTLWQRLVWKVGACRSCVTRWALM